jgi:DNA-binding transcriptional MerR regulator
MTITDSDEVMTTGAASRLLERSESTVRKYEREGLLQAIRSNTNIRLFKRADVERLRQQRARACA